jgi:hypothetical protein
VVVVCASALDASDSAPQHANNMDRTYDFMATYAKRIAETDHDAFRTPETPALFNVRSRPLGLQSRCVAALRDVDRENTALWPSLS